MATTGMSASISDTIPNQDIRITITPVAAEYPIRPPIAFQPG
jgi:hypothetical protein